jgi:putative peptidoglycan lipid II flippase
VLFFTVHYLMLRGFYALERTRTVFWVQCVIAATNIAVALALVHATDARFTSPALVLAYTASYAVGSVLSFLLLRHLLGGLRTRLLVRFLLRMVLAAGTSTAVAALVAHLLRGLVDRPSQLVALATGATVLLVDVAVFVGMARLLHVHEVTSLLDTVRRRLPSARR